MRNLSGSSPPRSEKEVRHLSECVRASHRWYCVHTPAPTPHKAHRYSSRSLRRILAGLLATQGSTVTTRAPTLKLTKGKADARPTKVGGVVIVLDGSSHHQGRYEMELSPRDAAEFRDKIDLCLVPPWLPEPMEWLG